MNIKRGLSALIPLIFFGSIFYYYYSIADYRIYEQNGMGLFLFDQHYLKGFLNYPGGLAEYFANFLFQFFHLKFPGAVIMLIIAAASSLITSVVYKRLSPVPVPFLHLLPPLLIVSLFGAYSLPDLGISYILASLAFMVYLGIEKGKMKLIYTLAVFIPLYIVTASFSLLFLISTILYELINFKKQRAALQIAVSISLLVLVPYISFKWIYVISLDNAYKYLLPLIYRPGVPYANIIYIVFLPLLTVFSLLKFTKTRPGRILENGLLIFSVALLILITKLVFEKSMNSGIKLLITTEKLAYEEKWDELLELSSSRPNSSDIIASYTNLALYKKGLLSEYIFSFPQINNEYGLIVRWRDHSEVSMPGSDLYFALGLYNASYRWAYEGFVDSGANHRNLKRLVETNILTGDYLVAEKYISILEKSLFYRKWAKKQRKFLFNEELLHTNNYYKNKLRLKVYENSFFAVMDNVPNLELLLRANPNNHMAFEYLMAHYLLKKEIEKFGKHIEQIKNFGYKKIPRSWEEALLVYESIYKVPGLKSENLSISETTREQFRAYTEIYHNTKSKPELARESLKQYKNTFWHYIHFVQKSKDPAEAIKLVDR